MLKQLARDGSVYAVGALVSRGLALLAVPLYTAFLAPSAYGRLDMLLTAGVLLTLVVALEVGQGLAREWAALGDVAQQRRMAGTAIVFTVGMHAVFLALALPAAPAAAQWLFHDVRLATDVRAGLVYIAANALYLQLQAQFRWSQRPQAYAVVSLLYGLLSLGLGWLCGARWGVAGVLAGQALAAALAAGVCVALLKGDICWVLDTGHLRRMLQFALPLVPAGLASFASFQVNRFFLNAQAGAEAVGHFSVAARVAGIAALLTVGVQTALTPLVYKQHAKPDTPRNLVHLLELFFVAALTLSLGLSLFAAELVRWLAGPDFGPAAMLVAWLVPATLLSQAYIFFPGMAIARRSGLQLVITAATAVVAVLLNLYWISLWGGTGAAMASLVASALFLGLWCVAGQASYRLPLRPGRLGAVLLAYLVLLAVGSVLEGAAPGTLWAGFAKLALLLCMMAAGAACGLLHWQRPTSRHHHAQS